MVKPVSRVVLQKYWYPLPAVRPPYTATYRTFSNTKPFDLSSNDDSPILKLHSTDVGRLFMERTQNANQIPVQRRLARMLLFILQNPGCRYLSLTATFKQKKSRTRHVRYLATQNEHKKWRFGCRERIGRTWQVGKVIFITYGWRNDAKRIILIFSETSGCRGNLELE
jgi:hypothetical protein